MRAGSWHGFGRGVSSCAGLAGFLDGSEAGDEGGERLDGLGRGFAFEEFEQCGEGELVGVEDGLVVRLDCGDVGHGGPLRCTEKWTILY